jgi:hypothetical protein
MMKNVTFVQIEKGATNMFQSHKECNIGSKGKTGLQICSKIMKNAALVRLEKDQQMCSKIMKNAALVRMEKRQQMF